MPNPTDAQVRAHYANDVANASDAQVAALIRADVTAPSQVKRVLADMAIDEAQRRGHALPTFWALTFA